MDVRRADAQQCVAYICCLYPISQRALLSPHLLPACTHACVQCMRSACVAPCLRIRRAPSSLRPQGSGGGVTRNLPFSSLRSLRLRNATNPNNAHRDLPASQSSVSWLLAPGSWCQCLLSITSPRRAGSAAPQTTTRNTHHAPNAYFTYFALYSSTCRFRNFVAKSSQFFP
jgi:hypothetical protein